MEPAPPDPPDGSDLPTAPCPPGVRGSLPLRPGPDHLLGTELGPYRILERIGEGGFGDVYVAEQGAPLRRLVALKLVKPGMDTRAVLARFDAERAVLALMDHPNIARVFDAGTTPLGRPYFVMELVRGVPLTRYCDDARLDIDARLDLFTSVCHAVQHAHQKGIIHRDLKPGNVLVMQVDGRAIPKVIDFGIAKAADPDATIQTMQGQWIGTPEYMSPEQAGGSGADIDTRSDVYSLGIVLYEILTGTLPFGRSLRSVPFAEIARTIREAEPPRPSTRLSAARTGPTGDGAASPSGKDRLDSRELARIAACRATDPRGLHRRIRGELDWITMRCLEKDRGRRYETAAALARDIEHYREGLPVSAGPPGVTYRIRKLAMRHRVAFAAGTAILVSLVAGVALATFGLVRAQRERDAARVAEGLARSSAAKSAAVSDFLREMLSAADPGNTRGREVTVKEALDAAAARVDGGTLAASPDVEADVRVTIGTTYEALGLLEPAERHLRLALASRRAHEGARSAEVATAAFQLARLLIELEKFDEAEALARESLAIDSELYPADDDRLRPDVTQLALVLDYRGHLEDAEPLYRRALDMARARHGPDSPEVAAPTSNLASVLIETGETAEAEGLLRDVLAIDRGNLGTEHPETATDLGKLGVLLADVGKLTEADSLLVEALGVRRRVLGDGHPDVARSWGSLAGLRARQRRFAEAESALARSLAIDLVARRDTSRTVRDLTWFASVMASMGELERAERLHGRRLELARSVHGPGSPEEADGQAALGDILTRQGRPREAEPLLRRSASTRRRRLQADDWRIASADALLGTCLLRQRRWAEAESLLLGAVEALRSNPAAPASRSGDVAADLVDLYTSWGRPADAEKWRAASPSHE